MGMCAYIQRPEEDVSCPSLSLLSYSLRQNISLNQKGGWQPARPIDPPAPQILLPQSWGHKVHMCQHQACYLGAGILMLLQQALLLIEPSLHPPLSALNNMYFIWANALDSCLHRGFCFSPICGSSAFAL